MISVSLAKIYRPLTGHLRILVYDDGRGLGNPVGKKASGILGAFCFL